MSSFKSFIFEEYSFDKDLKEARFSYSFDQQINFTEKLKFDFDFSSFNLKLLDQALYNLFLMLGVSYFKAYPVKDIVIRDNRLDQEKASFFNRTYQKGLGEYFFVNKLDPKTVINFPYRPSLINQKLKNQGQGLLIGIGGGKDSILVCEELKNKGLNLKTWSLNHQELLEPLVDKLGTDHLFVKRTIDPLLITLNDRDALNGHVPFSAILSFVGIVVAILAGLSDVVVGNESSASEPNLVYQGVSINHQYSKSINYEQDFQKLLAKDYINLNYYSFLRPLSELRIAEIFALKYFKKYKDVFNSCNRGYTLASKHLYWCGECSKCAFIYLILAPFVLEKDLNTLWGGKNLLFEPKLDLVYRELLGITGHKPLDCVGEVKEARSAMSLCQKIYPELKNKYSFDTDKNYNYKDLGKHLMPREIYQIFFRSIPSN